MKTAALLLLLALGGCTENDAYRRAGMWQPTGSVAGNLTAMAELPDDLIRGRSALAPTQASVDAVNRLWDDRARPLIGGTASAPVVGTVGGSQGKGG